LKNPQEDWKDRVAICFILEQMSAVDPLITKIIESLMIVLESEQDPHVREFAVWALGKIVEKAQSLDLIKKTMPTIIRFLNDDSEQVKTQATELHDRFTEVLKEKEYINIQIQDASKALRTIIDEKLEDMKNRSDDISKEALGLDYKAASDKYNEMKMKIQDFNQINQTQEDEIVEKEEELIKQLPAFKGESGDIIRYWREKRGEKEDLIRRIECIIRIQSKIFNIIQFILSVKPTEEVDLDKITEITKATGRPYSEKEVVEILQQLVDEEIIPNFMLNQIKDYQIKKEELETDEKKETDDIGNDNSDEQTDKD
jgi:hypothetical protein